MCNCNACFTAMSAQPTSVYRGALLEATSGEHEGDVYMLVRESQGAYAKDATGKNVGVPRFVFNLVNLYNEGKARVSSPERKLVWPTNNVPLDVIERHFGTKYKTVGRIEDVAGAVKTALTEQNKPATSPLWVMFINN